MHCNHCGKNIHQSKWKRQPDLVDNMILACPECGYAVSKEDAANLIESDPVPPDEFAQQLLDMATDALGVKFDLAGRMCGHCGKRRSVLVQHVKQTSVGRSWFGHGLCVPCMYENAMDLGRRIRKERDAMQIVVEAACALADRNAEARLDTDHPEDYDVIKALADAVAVYRKKDKKKNG